MRGTTEEINITRDNDGRVNTNNGNPGPDVEPVDVIKCRECGNLVRRINTQHLQTDRCRYTQPEKVRVNRDDRDDLLRPDHPETLEEYKDKHPDAPVVAPRERMKLAEANRDPEVDSRRKEMLKRRWRGEPMTNIVESLARKNDVTENAIWKDWADRSKWIDRVFGLDDAEAVVVEALAEKTDIKEELRQMARRAEDQEQISEAIRALKAVDDNLDDIIDHQKDLTEVGDRARRQEVHVEGEVTHEHKPGEDLDEETLKQLDELTGGEDEDVVDAEFEVVEEGSDAD